MTDAAATVPTHGLRGRIAASPRYRWVVLWTMLFGLFTVTLNFTVLAVVLPDIAQEFGTTVAVAQFAISLPILAFGAVGPAVGKLADMFGARRTYLIGFAGSVVLMAATGFSWNIGALIVIRVLLVTEGAATGPATTKIIAMLFSPDERPKALSWWSATTALGPTIGLVVGAAVLQVASWQTLYFIQAGLCAVSLVVAWYVIPETPRSAQVRFDVPGAVLLAASMGTLLFGIDRIPDWGARPATFALFVVAALLLAAFVAVELRRDEPMFPLHYFGRRDFSLALSASTFVNAAYLGGFVLAVPLMQTVLGYSESQRGLVVATRPLAFALLAPVGGVLIARFGQRVIGTVGAVLVAVSMLVLAGVVTSTPLWAVVVGLALAGVGFGWCQPAFNSAMINSVAFEDQGIGGGMAASVGSIGAAAGTVLLSAVQAGAVDAGEAVDSFRDAYLVGAALCAVAVVLAFAMTPHRRTAAPSLADELAADPAETGELRR